MAWPLVLVRYGEIGIKTRSVRLSFERRLVERIEEQLLRRQVEAEVTRDFGRIYLRAREVDAALDALAHTFGVVSASPAEECEATLQAVSERLFRVADERLQPNQSFAFRVKRTGQQPFTSLDVAKAAAALVLERLKERKPRVDLDEPDLAIHAEVRESGAYVFTRTIRGPGGLPLGSQGRVGVLVDGPRAAHAAWLMGKRGSALLFFAHDVGQAEAWLQPLAPWVPNLRVRSIESKERPDAMREMASILRQHRCEALVLGDGAQQAVLSFETDRLLGDPVFRPLVGFEGKRFEEFCRVAELPVV